MTNTEKVQKLLDNKEWKQAMYEGTYSVKWLNDNGNRMLKVVPQTEVWRIIFTMQLELDEANHKLRMLEMKLEQITE